MPPVMGIPSFATALGKPSPNTFFRLSSTSPASASPSAAKASPEYQSRSASCRISKRPIIDVTETGAKKTPSSPETENVRSGPNMPCASWRKVT